jgi:hypothetical protein
MKTDTAFFFLNKPDSKSPSAGIIKSTKLPATSIHAVSPVSIGNGLLRSVKLNNNNEI